MFSFQNDLVTKILIQKPMSVLCRGVLFFINFKCSLQTIRNPQYSTRGGEIYVAGENGRGIYFTREEGRGLVGSFYTGDILQLYTYSDTLTTEIIQKMGFR